MRPVYLLALVAACGDPSTPAVDASDEPADAEVTPDAMQCTTPDDCDWLVGYLQEVDGKLAGAEEIAPGVTLTARQSVSERAAARDYVEAELERMGLDPVRDDFGTGTNILATLPGTGGAVIACAHFDGVAGSPAAADDGTGTALVLAAARYLKDRPHDHPIVFALFDSEEVGLVGSQSYSDDLLTAGTEVTAVHCFDMISFDGDQDHAIELWSPSASLIPLYTTHADARSIPVRTVTFTSSDHDSFLGNGFVATGVGEEFVSGDHTPHYHQPTDTFDKIDFTYLADMARLAFDVLEDQATD